MSLVARSTSLDWGLARRGYTLEIISCSSIILDFFVVKQAGDP